MEQCTFKISVCVSVCAHVHAHIYVSVCMSVYKCVCVCDFVYVGQRITHGNWFFLFIILVLGILEIEPSSSGLIVNTVTHFAILPAQILHFKDYYQ